MNFTDQQNAALVAKLSPEHVSTRSQAGRNLSYIEGWWAISEANRIFGHDGWHRETIEMREVRPSELVTVTDKYGKAKEQWRVGYLAKVKITVGTPHAGIVREGTGYGSGAMGDLGEAVESAIKEAETDAMKRALMTFGNPFGLALYDKSRANVGDDEPEPAPVKSSASLKREGAWEDISAELEADLLDCGSLAALEAIKTIYRGKAADMKFPPAWMLALKDRFDSHEAALAAALNSPTRAG